MPILKHGMCLFSLLRFFDELFDVINDDPFLTLQKTPAFYIPFFQASFNYHNLAAQAHHGSSNNNGLFNECSMTAAAAANYYYNTASNWNTPASDYKII